MYSLKNNAISTLILLKLNLLITIVLVKSYKIPEPLFEVLKPQGLRISIPDEPGLQYFTFHGNVNNPILSEEVGELTDDIFRAKNGRWTLEKKDLIIQNGDVINYWIYVQFNGASFKKQNQSYTIRASDSSKQTTIVSPVTPTIASPVKSTISPHPEKGQLILNEDFNYLNESLWSRDVKIPLEPDYEFCIYHNDNHPYLVQIIDGVLRIQPVILEDLYGVNITIYGKLNLAGCTSNIPQECSQNAEAFNILPPIISAKLNTKTRFAFKYGKIEIRAKFPEGDWLYPELWLEPLYSLYGPNYASGRVLLGFARGNANLVDTKDFDKIFDARKLEFGFRSGFSTIHEETIHKIMDRGSRWNQDFHVYTTIWNENGFEFLVDGEEIGRLTSTTKGSWLHQFNISSITNISPFDQEFYISIGVGVGGRRVFPDNIMSSGFVKPWKNVGAKAILQFWNARNQWLQSWRRDDSRKTALEVDYVKVWSLE
ncbi:PREDICTED: beta-1,3-glucan-binding protein-like [Polistes canadensis]|uniref:beta-1,3-glucan-binding protein-like n=1 Tax=Polistes canadensis TaxID=91411 RepID=UPI000718D088|nr:PREDICTED: beta-1,3-glucan-binding protein-like [Polistes canadensis]